MSLTRSRLGSSLLLATASSLLACSGGGGQTLGNPLDTRENPPSSTDTPPSSTDPTSGSNESASPSAAVSICQACTGSYSCTVTETVTVTGSGPSGITGTSSNTSTSTGTISLSGANGTCIATVGEEGGVQSVDVCVDGQLVAGAPSILVLPNGTLSAPADAGLGSCTRLN